jgi:hypothetical protein
MCPFVSVLGTRASPALGVLRRSCRPYRHSNNTYKDNNNTIIIAMTDQSNNI